MINQKIKIFFLICLVSLSKAFSVPCPRGVCPDGTISQSSKIKNGCGQEAVANIISMYCHKQMSPRRVNFFNWDLTPGTRARTLEGYVQRITVRARECNRLIGRKFKLRNYSRKNFLYYLKKALRKPRYFSINYFKRNRGFTNPVIVPTFWNTEGHYVTVVDIIHNRRQCDVVVNHWGRQEKINCKEFLNKASVRGNTNAWWTRKSTGSYGIFSFQ